MSSFAPGEQKIKKINDKGKGITKRGLAVEVWKKKKKKVGFGGGEGDAEKDARHTLAKQWRKQFRFWGGGKIGGKTTRRV